MNRRILRFYYIMSMLFLLFILLFAAYRLKITVDANRKESQKTLEALRISALSIFLAEGSFDTEYFRNTIREKFQAADRLVLLSIYSDKDGLQYLISKDTGYLVQAPELTTKGAPEYTIRPVYENLISLRLGPGIRPDLFIDGIFQDLNRAQLYPILREIFYVLLVYLLIASVFLLFAATVRTSADYPKPSRLSTPSITHSSPRGRNLDGAGLFSPSTGLGWSQHLSTRLASELERAAGSDQDLSLLFIHAAQGDLRNLATAISTSFPLQDLIFEYDASTAAVILPDRDLDQSLKEARDFQQKSSLPVAMGLSARNGRLISANRLLSEAAQALKKAESEGGIVAFRVDADKYRAAISASSLRSSQRR